MKNTILIAAIAALLTIGSCSSDNDFAKGKRQLENMGYTNVENTGYKAFCCGKDDGFSTGFIAIDKNGQIVEGCFCSSAFKGVTIRFE